MGGDTTSYVPLSGEVISTRLPSDAGDSVIALPAFTEEQMRLISECVSHLEAILKAFGDLYDETHMCEHRREVALMATVVLPRLSAIATYHADVDCRKVPELRDHYRRWAVGHE